MYRDLEVYRKSYELAISICEYAKTMPNEERYELTSQIRRAATSVPLNIAEGYGKRESQQEFRRYLMMAKGSSTEMQVLLDMCKDLGYMKEDHYKRYWERYDEVSRMLAGMIKTIG